MTTNKDTRVVEMRFDNGQFERETKTTLRTLTKLKEALKLPNSSDALKDLDKAAKNVQLSGLQESLDILNKKFSAFGVAGMTVVSNLTTALTGKLASAMSFVSDSIVSGGVRRAMNIENAHFQLQALLKDESKVQAIMADAMTSVDGTAYAYDEAAKAASQFAASGIEAGEEMLQSLKGITGVAAMTNSEYESISNIFTTVAGNGRLMGDQLLQLSSRGMNAAATIADYYKQVRGEAGMTEATIRDMVSDGEISFDTFAKAMNWAFGESAERANETFNGAFSNMKSALARIGADFVSPLVEQNGELVKLFNALRVQINNFKSTITFDEQRSAIAGLTEVTGIADDKLKKMFENIDKNGAVTISQMNKLTKNGADSTKALTDYINGVVNGTVRASYATVTALTELTKGTEVSEKQVKKFVKSGKIDVGVFTSAMEKSFGTEKTVVKQFTDVVLDGIGKIADYINSINLTDSMTVFYNVFASTTNVVKGLLSVLKPVGQAFSDVFLSFKMESVIEMTSKLEDFTYKLKLSKKGSENLKDAMTGFFNVLKLGVDLAIWAIKVITPINKPIAEAGDGFLGFIGMIGRSLTYLTEAIRSSTLLSNVAKKISSGVSTLFDYMLKGISIIRKFVGELITLEGVKELIDAIGDSIYAFVQKSVPKLSGIKNGIVDMAKSALDFDSINFADVLNSISNACSRLAYIIRNNDFTDAILKIYEVVSSNESLNTYINNLENFVERLRDALTFDATVDRLEKVMDVFGKFFNWIKELFSNFSDINLGNTVAAGGGLAIIYSLIKAANSIDKVANSLKAIPSLFGGINKTLTAYQKNLNAQSFFTIAKGILVLAAAITILSFADMKNAWQATMMLAALGAALTAAVGSFILFSQNIAKIDTALNQIGKGIKIKLIGSAIKDVAASLAIVAASIIAIGLMWRKDPEATEWAIYMIGKITLVIAAMVGFMLIAAKVDGKGVNKVGTAILAVSLALFLVIKSLSKLFKMELPSDYDVKLKILAGIFAGLAALIVVIGIAARLSGGKQIDNINKTFTSMGILLVATVLSLKALFKMELPSDYDVKLKILAGIFVGLGALIVVMGVAARLSGGNGFKAGTTILAMAAFLAVVVGSLFVLTLIPGDKLMKGTGAISAVLIALAIALAGAGKISNDKTNKVVLAMAITVGVIVASLAILSMISENSLLKAVTALGSVLLILAIDFLAISKITNERALLNVVGMIAATLSIAYSLYTLSEQPWESLLAAGTSLSMVLIVLSTCFAILSKINVDLKSIAVVVAGSASLLLVSKAIASLAQYDGQSLLNACLSLSAMLVVMVGVMAACAALSGVTGPAIVGVLGLGVVIAEVALVLAALSALTDIDGLEDSIMLAGDLLEAIGNAFGKLIGGLVGGTLSAISSQLPQVGTDLSEFMDNIRGFLDGITSVNSDMLASAGMLAGIITALSISEIINAVAGLTGASLPDLGIELSTFMVSLTPFLMGIKSISSEDLEACKNLADMIIKLTAAKLLDGISSFLPMSGSFESFAEELDAIAPSIVSFSNKVKGIDSSAVSSASSSISILAEASGKLEAHGGWLQSIKGDKSLKTFAEELNAMAPAIKDFSDKVQGIKESSVKGAAAAIEIIAEAENALKNHGGLKGLVFGDSTLKDFAEELNAMAPAIKDFSDKVQGIKESSVKGAAAAIEIIADAENALKNHGGLKGLVFGDSTLEDFGYDLRQLGLGLHNFSALITNVDPDKVEASIDSVTGIISLLDDVSGVDATDLATFSTSLGDIGLDGVNKFIKAFKDKYDEAVRVISNLVGKMIANIKFVQAIKFMSAGIDAAKGFVNGIKTMLPSATSAGNALGMAAYEAAKKALDEHSPSKKMGEVGRFAGLGFINNLKPYVARAYETGKEIGDRTVDGISKSIDYARYIVNTGMDWNPVISPTVDLGNVRKSAASINGMFNNSVRLAVANANEVDMMIGEYLHGKYQNNEITSELKGLRKDLAGTTNNTTNYTIDGVSYEEGSNISEAIKTIASVARQKSRRR